MEIARGIHRTTTNKGGPSESPVSLPSATTAPQKDADNRSYPQRRVRRCFPLEKHHFGIWPRRKHQQQQQTPEDFHQLLVQKIQSAQKRVYLASLYIGPAVCRQKYDKEADLLAALSDIPDAVEVKILLDRNRALRPVPVTQTNADSHSAITSTTTTTSAEACRQALQSSFTTRSTAAAADANISKNHSIHLFSVLPAALQKILRNPVDEVMGVFHIKVYIIDDELILSGANLSQEYFADRTDRYLWICQGGAGLVDCYSDLVQVLCDHAHEYHGPDSPAVRSSSAGKEREPLVEALERVLTVDAAKAAAENLLPDDSDNGATTLVAYAVPTFQAPAHFNIHPRICSDVETVHQLLSSAADSCSVHMATAYLNPTDAMIAACHKATAVHMLTAGYVSHGFKPKNKAGNKGKAWIPTVFSVLALKALEKFPANNGHLWYYQRPDWTFHAKGIWLSDATVDVDKSFSPRISSPLYMVTHGSGNFGGRSEYIDMESNLLLLLPSKSPLQSTFRAEWNSLCDFASSRDSSESDKPLAWYLRMALPYIRTFF